MRHTVVLRWRKKGQLPENNGIFRRYGLATALLYHTDFVIRAIMHKEIWVPMASQKVMQ